MALKKCVVCGQPIEVNQKAVPYKGRYAHETCFNNLMKITLQKKQDQIEEEKNKKTKTRVAKPKIQDFKTEEEFQEQAHFFETLKSICQAEQLPAKVYKIADDYVKKFGFSYKGMENSIRYFFLIQEHEIEGDGIGIIPYIYDEAQDFFTESEEINQTNSDIMERGDKLYQTRVIRVKPNYENTSQLIDMDNFWGDADVNR